jgi:hypothetical protein
MPKPIFNLVDIQRSMEAAEVVLATAAARNGGRIRLSWWPGKGREVFTLVRRDVNGTAVENLQGALTPLLAEFGNRSAHVEA